MFKSIFGGGKNREGEDLYRPRMPDVDVPADIDSVFAQARNAARNGPQPQSASAGNRHLVVVTPGRLMMFQPCPPAGSMPASQVAPIEKMLPPAVKRDVAVIAYTELEAVKTSFGKAIPFA